MGPTVRWRLSAMMALVYAVQGAWWPLLAVHLGDLRIAGPTRAAIFGTMAFASLVTPLGAGHLVDRLMSTERYLAVAYGVGAVLLGLVASGLAAGPWSLLGLFFAYWLVIAPAFALSNSLAMRHLPRPAEEFGRVRLWGTVSWIAVGWLVTAVMTVRGPGRSGVGAAEAFWVASALAVVMSGYALTLPHTPPLARDPEALALSAPDWAFLRRPGVGVYLAIAFGVSLTTPFLYQAVPPELRVRGLSRAWIASAMTLSQVLEVAGLAALPAIIRWAGLRGTLALGIAAWMMMYALLAARLPLWVALASLPLNGVGFACFSIAGQIFLDGAGPIERRASVQSLQVVITSGIGSLAGNLLAGLTAGRPVAFAVAGSIAAAMLAVLLVAFRPDGRRAVVARPVVP